MLYILVCILFFFLFDCDIGILSNVLQEDTISINHNWLNGCNIDIMWQFLQNELSSVQKEISEWRNTMDSWHQHCQVLQGQDCSACMLSRNMLLPECLQYHM